MCMYQRCVCGFVDACVYCDVVLHAGTHILCLRVSHFLYLIQRI